ncbi:MAG: sigma-70 family RNA polymerase sigma factor [Clostridiales bacterium]
MESKFLTVFNNTKHDIYRLVRTYMKNSFDTDDIVQNVYLKLHKKIDDFNDDDHIKRWLIRVAINECKNYFLSSWMRKIVPLDETLVDESSFEPEDKVWQGVMDLPQKYRIVIYLFYYEEYSTAEIAEILKAQEATVRKQLQRARERLKATLKEAWDDEE